MLLNVNQGIPSAITFMRFHSDHHVFMGSKLDVDIPTQWEINNITTPFRKMIYVICYPFFYSIRPYLVAPKAPT